MSLFNRPIQKLKNAKTALAFRYMPSVAEFLSRLATREARRKLIDEGQLRLLVDSQIHAFAITHEDAWIDTGIKMWGGKIPIPTGYAARVAVHSSSDRTEEYRDICFLTGISYLARKQHISMFTSRELMAERERQEPRRFQPVGYSGFSLLSRVEIRPIDDWSFDALVHDVDRTGISLNQLQLNRVNLSQDAIFQTIWRILEGKKSSLDAWHLRTAQVHDLDGLLTMDYKLAKKFAQKQHLLTAAGITAKIWTPSGLAQELGIAKVLPNMFAYTDASFPVRPDLYLPNGRKRV